MGLYLSALWDWYFYREEKSYWVDVIEDGEVVARYLEWEVGDGNQIYINKLEQRIKQNAGK
jgi:hypothetical protein